MQDKCAALFSVNRYILDHVTSLEAIQVGTRANVSPDKHAKP